MPQSFIVRTGHAALLHFRDIDTDLIIPQTELVTASRQGLARGLFARWRYLPDGSLNPTFVLNQPEHADSRFLIAADNFGCGSSREHAVWALQEFGIEAVISSRYGEIFQRNCIRNGLLPAIVAPGDYERLEQAAFAARGGLELRVDLAECVLSTDQLTLRFQISADDRERLLSGCDEIDVTLSRRASIQQFVARDRVARPWVYEMPTENPVESKVGEAHGSLPRPGL